MVKISPANAKDMGLIPDAHMQAGARKKNQGSTERKREDGSFIPQRAGPMSFCCIFPEPNKVRGSEQALVTA